MPGIVAIVNAISDDVVAKLAAAGYPALADGKILLGRQHHAENHAPPRIIFIPTRSKFGMKDLSSAVPVASSAPYSDETLAQIRQRSVASDNVTFEVRCWGQFSSQEPDLDQDYDFTQALYQQTAASALILARGAVTIEDGDWTDSAAGVAQITHAGREFVFALTFATPVLDTLLPLAPSNTRTVPTTQMIGWDGSIDTGCSG